MAALTVEQITITGLEATPVTASGPGDTFANEGKRTFLWVNNGSGGDITLTFDDTGSLPPPGSVAFDADVDVIVTAGEVRRIGPFPVDRFTSVVAVTYSGVTSLTVAAMRL